MALSTLEGAITQNTQTKIRRRGTEICDHEVERERARENETSLVYKVHQRQKTKTLLLKLCSGQNTLCTTSAAALIQHTAAFSHYLTMYLSTFPLSGPYITLHHEKKKKQQIICHQLPWEHGLMMCNIYNVHKRTF